MYAILVDVTKCTGCERCVAACLETNRLDPVLADIDRLEARDGLSANRFIAIESVADGRFARKSCMHCMDPSCVSACLVGGLTKSEHGPVIYDSTKCIGCRYCMLACPFHIPRYQWSKTAPIIRKCNMCTDRLQHGQLPSCVEACPNQALLFGDRDFILKEARKRIDHEPNRYIRHVWGEHEFGGTSVMYISDVDLAQLGWSTQIHAGIPMLTNPLIESTPIIGMSVATGLLAVNWIIRRRMRLSKQSPQKNQDKSDYQSEEEA
jgi:formate dehydrogenase iron-sulfur subunit